MSGLIRREEVLKKLNYEMKYGAVIDQCGLDTAYDIIENIPSAEPERKKSRWIYDTERVWHDGGIYAQYHCSECRFQIIGSLYNYCPFCGADMRGEDGKA